MRHWTHSAWVRGLAIGLAIALLPLPLPISSAYAEALSATDSAATRPPVLQKIGDQTARVGVSLCIAPSASDPDNHELIYSFTSHNPESQIHEDATIHPTTGRFCWTARPQDAEKAYDVTLTVKQKQDGGLSASEKFSIRVEASIPKPVTPLNVAPTVNAGRDQAIALPAQASLAGKVTDDGLPNPPGALTLAWTKVSGPGMVTFGNPNTANTTVEFSEAGLYTLRLSAFDGILTGADDVMITTQAQNRPPVFTPVPPQTVKEGEELAFTLTAIDPEGAAVTYHATQLPGRNGRPHPGITFKDQTGAFRWLTDESDAGRYEAHFTATDADGQTAELTVPFIIEDVPLPTAAANHPPVFQTPLTDQRVTAGQPLILTLQATDPDEGETVKLRYFVLGIKDISLPMGIQIRPHPDGTAGKALFMWPAVTRPGTYPVTVVVTDKGLSQGSQAELTFNVIVEAVKQPNLPAEETRAAPQADPPPATRQSGPQVGTGAGSSSS